MSQLNTPIFRLLSIVLVLVLLGAAPLHAQKKGKNKNKKSATKDKSDIEDRLKPMELLLQCLDLDPIHAASRYEYARLLYQKEEPASAVGHAESALRLEPDNKWYRVLVAECYAQMRDFEKAAGLFDDLRSRHPESIDFYFDAAFLYKSAGDLKNAIRVLDDLEKIIGKDESVLLEKQKMYMMEGDVDKAAAEIRKLITAYPKRSNYYNLLAELYLVNKRPEDADAVYRELMQVDPDNPFGQLAMV